MSLKRECDVCGAQQDHGSAKMVPVELPAIPGLWHVDARKLDCCYDCARRLHKAAERVVPDSAPEPLGR